MTFLWYPIGLLFLGFDYRLFSEEKSKYGLQYRFSMVQWVSWTVNFWYVFNCLRLLADFPIRLRILNAMLQRIVERFLQLNFIERMNCPNSSFPLNISNIDFQYRCWRTQHKQFQFNKINKIFSISNTKQTHRKYDKNKCVLKTEIIYLDILKCYSNTNGIRVDPINPIE